MVKRVIMSIVLTLLSFSFLNAGEFCPENIQAVLLVKVLSFTRELGGASKGDVSIGVLNGGAALNAIKDAATKAGGGVSVKSVTTGDIAGINVLYVSKGTSADQVQLAKEKCKQLKIMSVGGDPQFVLDYNYSLTFHLVDSKPRMLVSIESADEEGTKFAAEFLKIAEKK